MAFATPDEHRTGTKSDKNSSAFSSFHTSTPPYHCKSRYLYDRLAANGYIELQLLLLTLSTGIQDAISFPDFLCFASNQTGNTILLAVGLTGFRGEFFQLPTVATSLSMFLTGAIITGQLGNLIGPRQRLWQVLSNIVQVILVLGTATIQYIHGQQSQGPWALGAIALLAFSSGVQVAAAREFRLTEISTAMATAAWVDLVIDPHLLVAHNRPRNRRALFLVALAIGALAGAFIRARIGSALALTISAIIKALVIPMLLVAQADPPPSRRVSVAQMA